jgi:hypothetical protein
MSSSTQCGHDEFPVSRLLQNGRSQYTTLAVTLHYAHLLQAESANKLATPRRWASWSPRLYKLRSVS